MTLQLSAFTDPDAFDAQAQDALHAEPVRTSIVATAIDRARAGTIMPDARWWIARAAGAGDERGPILGLGMQTLPTRPYLAWLDPQQGAQEADFGAAVAADLHAHPSAVSISGVNGSPTAARGFAQEWVARHGGAVRFGRQDILYDLPGPVRTPAPVPGRARPATIADREWLDDWGRSFIRDIGDPPDPALTMERPVDDGRLVIWEIPADGAPDLVPVAMAYSTVPAHGHVRLGWVWTDPARRGEGFGSAVTAAVSAAAQADGLHCLLLADARNAASNAVYRRLGYQPVGESCHLHLDAAPR